MLKLRFVILNLVNFFLFFIIVISKASLALAENQIIIQSTTSTANSGLLDAILPVFEKDSGVKARVVAVGTGQAIKNAANGDADILLVHSKAAEEAFVSAGWGVKRYDVMYNDFVLVGPYQDPAKILGMQNVTDALKLILDSNSSFISRGDNSGTHIAEKRLWEYAKIGEAELSGGWYREIGSGMGATLNMASAVDAYTLSDRATWLSFGNKGTLKVMVEEDPRLFNQYGVIAVSANRYPSVNQKGARKFIKWLTGRKGQAQIAKFKVNGRQLFFPNAADY